MGLLISIVNASVHTKCVSLRDQNCNIRATVINVDPNDHIQGLGYYPFAVNLDNVSAVLMLLMAYLIKYMLYQIKQKI